MKNAYWPVSTDEHEQQRLAPMEVPKVSVRKRFFIKTSCVVHKKTRTGGVTKFETSTAAFKTGSNLNIV